MVSFDNAVNVNNANANNAYANDANANDANAKNAPSWFVGGARARTMLLAALIIIIIIRARALHSAKPYCNRCVFPFSVFRVPPNESRFWGDKRESESEP